MYSSLMPQMLGLRANLGESIELAGRHGFRGVDADGASLSSLSNDEIVRLRERFAATATIPGYIGLPPGRMPLDGSQWDDAIAAWPRIAQVARELGYERTALVLLPFHESLEREAALDEHERVLRQIAPILGDYGLRLGLEYVAAPSRRAPYATHTLWNLAGMMELLERVEAPNLGVMLDTFHWHGAGETAADLERLRSEQIVVVHANDAPDIPLDQHTVMQRALPGATGVVDSTAFFQTLKKLGYDGPVTCEPMQPAIDALHCQDADEVCALVKTALDRVLAL
jgi:sugar phosphate isomerase/epimerase